LTRHSVPLCFCYRSFLSAFFPFSAFISLTLSASLTAAMLHYKACATTRKQKALDIALFVFGLVAALYTTSQTVSRPSTQPHILSSERSV